MLIQLRTIYFTIMQSKTIRLSYKKTIDAAAKNQWEKKVFEDTYSEFLLQAQLYTGSQAHSIFTQLAADTAKADKINFLVSSVVGGHLKQLSSIMPDVVNSMGSLFVPFKHYRFQVLESDTSNKASHKIAIYFISEPLLWHACIGDQLLLSAGITDVNDGALLTHMLELHSSLSVFSITNT